MMRAFVFVATLLLSGAQLIADDAPPAKQFRALVDEFEDEGGARRFAKRFLTLAEMHPHDPAAVDALLWVVDNVRGRADTDRAVRLLSKQHIKSSKLGAAACARVANARSVVAESFLRTLVEKSPHQSTRAQACYYLALLLDREATILEQLAAQPELAPRVLQYYGRDYGKHLASLDLKKLTQEREKVYVQLRDSFAAVKTDDTTMGKLAKKTLFAIRHLSVGRQAPEIQGEDVRGREFRLSDYRGKVVMLTFWGHW